MPNGLNKYAGAFYANSSTTGNWDDYITRDVVGLRRPALPHPARPRASRHRRPLHGRLRRPYPRLPPPRGLRLRLRPQPLLHRLTGDMGPSNPAWRTVAALKSPDEVPAALHHGDFFVAAFAAMSAALAPDPSAPTFGDPPFTVHDGQLSTNLEAFSRIAANMPANMVFPLLPNIVQTPRHLHRVRRSGQLRPHRHRRSGDRRPALARPASPTPSRSTRATTATTSPTASRTTCSPGFRVSSQPSSPTESPAHPRRISIQEASHRT